MSDLAIAAAGADPGNGRAGVLTVTLRISSWLGFVACVPSAEVATLRKARVRDDVQRALKLR